MHSSFLALLRIGVDFGRLEFHAFTVLPIDARRDGLSSERAKPVGFIGLGDGLRDERRIGESDYFSENVMTSAGMLRFDCCATCSCTFTVRRISRP